MKKILVCLLICFALLGCKKEHDTSIYDEMILEIKDYQDYKTKSENFESKLYVSQLEENRYQYDVVINHPKVKMDDVRAIVICESEQGYVYPSFGFEEGEHCYLYPDYIDQESNYYEGIRLSGISKKDKVVCRLYITYHINQEIVEEYIILEG